MLRLEPPDIGAASGPPHLALAQADTRRQQAAVTLTDLAAGTPGEGLATAGAAAPAKRGLAALTIAAIGVVYGDIGTSPLYTMREVFGSGALPLTEASVLGGLSLVSWALFTIVTLKYVIVIPERVVLLKSKPRTCPGCRTRSGCRSSTWARTFTASWSATASWSGRTWSRRSPPASSALRSLPSWKPRSFSAARPFLPSARPDLPWWQEHIFIHLANAALDATKYFKLPPDRVVEVGSQVEI